MNTALTAIQEGRGFNSFIPLALQRHLKIVITNVSEQDMSFFYQLDYTLGAGADDGYLHCTFRRENPTTLKQDFVIEDGLRGPGRFLGCVVGIRCFEGQVWYGEGEVKIFKDGDTDYPTICGTGLEDYVGTAWGMGPHVSFYAGSQVDISQSSSPTADFGNPDSSASYRLARRCPDHVRAPMKVTIQQIGYDLYWQGQEHRAPPSDEATAWSPATVWHKLTPGEVQPPLLAYGIVGHVDELTAPLLVHRLPRRAAHSTSQRRRGLIADIENVSPYEPVPRHEATDHDHGAHPSSAAMSNIPTTNAIIVSRRAARAVQPRRVHHDRRAAHARRGRAVRGSHGNGWSAAPHASTTASRLRRSRTTRSHSHSA